MEKNAADVDIILSHRSDNGSDLRATSEQMQELLYRVRQTGRGI
jgi:hypothetical protein